VAVAPVTLALVDAGGGEDWLELVRGALAAALEALPASALFGLVTFGTHVRVCQPSSVSPSARALLDRLWPVIAAGGPCCVLLVQHPSCHLLCAARPAPKLSLSLRLMPVTLDCIFQSWGESGSCGLHACTACDPCSSHK